MARCVYCRAETKLYDSGVPTCSKCSEERAPRRKPPASDHKVRYALIEDLLDATVREKAAFDKFNAALDRFPTGLPHPDGSQRIRNASHELEAARKGLKKAHSRLSDFLERGTIPEDLKQTSAG
jgi:hypothetical protein